MYQNIRLLMLKNNISFEDIAEALNISRDTASKKINGKAHLSVDELLTIQKNFFTNYDLNFLVQKCK